VQHCVEEFFEVVDFRVCHCRTLAFQILIHGKVNITGAPEKSHTGRGEVLWSLHQSP
jgi:hypothetical protein